MNFGSVARARTAAVWPVRVCAQLTPFPFGGMEYLFALSTTPIPDANCAIGGRRSKEFLVDHSHAEDPFLMAAQRLGALAGGKIPAVNGLVQRTREENARVGVEQEA